MYLPTLWMGKAVTVLTRLAGNNGAALPGYVVERLNRRFLCQGLAKLPQGLVIVTGTNGKTTTTKMVADGLSVFGVRVLTNKSGSNFIRSLISVIVDKSSALGLLNYDIAIIELDEAYAAKLIEHYKPRGVVVLNITRDQMDRFGEIDITARLLEKVTRAATDFVVLSGHDPRVSALATGAKRSYFDVSPKLAGEFPNDDDWHGPRTSRAKSAKNRQADVVLSSFTDREAVYKLTDTELRLRPAAAGQHNFLNGAAALAVLRELLPAEPAESLGRSLEKVGPAFGRGEELTINGTKLRLQLVKNPASFTQALKLADKKPYNVVAIAINDDYADSRDVSWLWDVDFTALKNRHSKLITGGVRAHDMALRLKYDGFKASAIIPDNKRLMSTLLSGKYRSILLYCTYTAMWQLRRQLIRRGHVEYIR